MTQAQVHTYDNGTKDLLNDRNNQQKDDILEGKLPISYQEFW